MIPIRKVMWKWTGVGCILHGVLRSGYDVNISAWANMSLPAICLFTLMM